MATLGSVRIPAKCGARGLHGSLLPRAAPRTLPCRAVAVEIATVPFGSNVKDQEPELKAVADSRVQAGATAQAVPPQQQQAASNPLQHILSLAMSVLQGLVLVGATLGRALAQPFSSGTQAQGSAGTYSGLGHFFAALRSVSEEAQTDAWRAVPESDPLRCLISRKRWGSTSTAGTTGSSTVTPRPSPSSTKAVSRTAVTSVSVEVAGRTVSALGSAAVAVAPPAAQLASSVLAVMGLVMTWLGQVFTTLPPSEIAARKRRAQEALAPVPVLSSLSTIAAAATATPVPPPSMGKVCPTAQAKADATFAELTKPTNPAALQPGFKPTVQLPPPPPGVSGQAAVDATFAVLTQPTNPAALQPGFKPIVALPPPPPGTSGQAAVDAAFAALTKPANPAALQPGFKPTVQLPPPPPGTSGQAAVDAQFAMLVRPAHLPPGPQPAAAAAPAAASAPAVAAAAAAASSSPVPSTATAVRAAQPAAAQPAMAQPVAAAGAAGAPPAMQAVAVAAVAVLGPAATTSVPAHLIEPLVIVAGAASPEVVAAGVTAFQALADADCQSLREAHAPTFGLLAASLQLGTGFGVPAYRAMYLPRLSGLHAAAKADVPKLMQDLQAFTDLRPLAQLLAGRSADQALAALAALTQLVHGMAGQHTADGAALA